MRYPDEYYIKQKSYRRKPYEKNPNAPIIWKSLAIVFIAYRQYIGCRKWVNQKSFVHMLIGPKLVTVSLMPGRMSISLTIKNRIVVLVIFFQAILLPSIVVISIVIDFNDRIL